MEDSFVKKVRMTIEAHLDDLDFNVEQLCQEVHVSTSQLYRKMESLTGLSANKFIRLLRLKKAKQLLSERELSITSVAFDSGFSDPAYFARVFKKEFGMTPQEWRSKSAKCEV
ncbi:MAG TPA: AraC family transcriptional regulator [Saprospiraceae bacterium]|nr:AraC family transcriptional regulator [Saprospiraceae bacterium]HPI05093.1 AraC family transcriptional regulator [Saprospiraceae bacterium]